MIAANDNSKAARAKACRDLLNWVRRRGTIAELETIDLGALTDGDLELMLCGTRGPNVETLPHLGRVT
jgi:hypothetical protein